MAPSEDDSANRAAISRWMEISKSDGKVAELRDQVRPGGGGRMLDPDGLIGARQRNNVVVVVAAAAVVVVVVVGLGDDGDMRRMAGRAQEDQARILGELPRD